MPSSNTDSQSPIFWERLRNLFTPRRDEMSPDGEGPRRRGVVITTCVLISFTLWLTFTLQERKTATLSLPTEVINLPADRGLETLPPATVRARVEGEGLQLLWLSYNPPTVPLDAGRETVSLREAISLPDNVGLQMVNPQQVQLQTGPRITRQMPVQSRVTIDLAAAHELIGDPTIEPDSIEITGAQAVLDRMNAWPTASRTISGLDDTLTTRIPLADTLSRLVQRDRDFVTLTARAGKFAEDSRQIEVEVTGVPSDQNVVALEPSTIRVRYRVLFSQLFDAQRAPDFFATVSYDQIRRDTTGYVEPRLHLPSDLLIRDPEPIPGRLRYYTYVTSN